MTPEEYFKLCETHDWDFQLSDDPEVYRKGAKNQNRLLDLAQEHSELREIFLAWSRYAVPRKPQLSDFVSPTQKPG